MQLNIKIIQSLCLTGLVLFTFTSCKKGWLDAKPDKALVIPKSIRDYQAILDNSLDAATFNKTDALGEIGAGDFEVTDQGFNTLNARDRNLYKWAQTVFEEDGDGSWDSPYQSIFNANVVLEGLEKIKPSTSAEQTEWNQAKGIAFFWRAFHHCQVANIFCKPYDKSTAGSDMGIPLRLQSDFNIKSVRASIEETYSQILSDLKQAEPLIPVSSPVNTINKMRPTKAAVNAMLARVYLSMSKYDSAYAYANKALQTYSVLMNYNLSPPMLTTILPVPKFNDETILYCEGRTYLALGLTIKRIPASLYQLYDANDRRRDRFFYPFQGGYIFVGGYTNSGELFGGLATDELYLIRAECLARAGSKDAALNDLNTLLQTRWRNTVSYTPVAAVDANDALSKILVERRKELIFRCLRWSDLRRLNKEPQFAVTLTRTIAGTTYTLPPNSPLYVLPIPKTAILLGGLPQNPR